MYIWSPWDLETGPLNTERLEAIMPDFKPAKNIKDEEKKKANVEEKRRSFIEDAALSGISCQILSHKLGHEAYDGEDEHALLETVSHVLDTALSHGIYLVGWGISHFDVPVFTQRCWANGIRPPRFMDGRYQSHLIVDLQKVWTCGAYGADFVSLDTAARALGVGKKHGSGADFHKLYRSGDPELVAKAIAYRDEDIELIEGVARQMNIEHIISSKAY